MQEKNCGIVLQKAQRHGIIIHVLEIEPFMRRVVIYLASRYKSDSLAQLGERYLDRVEVAGSSPVGIIGCQTLGSIVGTTILLQDRPIRPDA